MEIFGIIMLALAVGVLFLAFTNVANTKRRDNAPSPSILEKEASSSDEENGNHVKTNNDVFSQKGYSSPHNFKKPSADILGEIFGAIVLTGAILCFFGALINAANAITGAEGGWFAAGVCLGVGIAMLFSYWMIKIFSKIYTTLVSIDSKLDDLNDKK